ncbi:hypothetical protein ND861_09755 [Leptospira sp. 2 VSF19]|uniref:Lipoprotein n=1 Tax=Leptospira soteropolitanensis TaxID=2950025 RepID=A0AAW5VLN2_9LEPT|nr:hypothetical protein [Leptospira soteropolitanensis]MCW7492509.1 hypothetical protein [Leptospira soteropolitanensis]MCW7500558.1 hypothetical protein [Leptospira soteropolitanensis]MCW7522772.1 hypothetical protein [Leptospira soteropolitanensis]MCW7526629.1 hypothetical protein [Leptospira soteropolitanensis]MCW7530528.1 hypothetical protein [Leptospira soteropolitanensis]
MKKINKLIFQKISRRIAFPLIFAVFFTFCQEKVNSDETNLLLLGALVNANSGPSTVCKTGSDGSVETTMPTIKKGTFALCRPSSGAVRHYRIEGLKIIGGHTAVSLYVGLPENYSAEVNRNSTLAAGQFGMNFYSGTGTGGFVPAYAYANFGPNESNIKNLTSNGNSTAPTAPAVAGTSLINFVEQEVDLCFDLTASSPPRLTVWVTGKNTANCKTRTNLTTGNALLNEATWTGGDPAVATGFSFIGLSANTGISFSKIVTSTQLAVP